MEQEVNKVLSLNGVNSSSQTQPPNFVESKKNPYLKADLKQFSKGSFYQISPPEKDDDIQCFLENISRNRRHYLRALENKAREETVKQQSQKFAEIIKEGIKNPKHTEFLNLFKERHKWLSNYQIYDEYFALMILDVKDKRKVETLLNKFIRYLNGAFIDLKYSVYPVFCVGIYNHIKEDNKDKNSEEEANNQKKELKDKVDGKINNKKDDPEPQVNIQEK